MTKVVHSLILAAIQQRRIKSQSPSIEKMKKKEKEMQRDAAENQHRQKIITADSR